MGIDGLNSGSSIYAQQSKSSIFNNFQGSAHEKIINQSIIYAQLWLSLFNA